MGIELAETLYLLDIGLLKETIEQTIKEHYGANSEPIIAVWKESVEGYKAKQGNRQVVCPTQVFKRIPHA